MTTKPCCDRETHTDSSGVSVIVFMGFDDCLGFVELRLRFFGFSGAGRGITAPLGKGGTLGGAGGSRNNVAHFISTSL